MFTAQDIRARVQQQPFLPLRIVTTAGQAYDLRHPDQIIIGGRTIYIGTPSTDDPQLSEQGTRVAILHITELRDLAASSKPGGNGELK